MKRILSSTLALSALAAMAAAGPSLAQQKMVQVKGSDTLVNLSQVWAEAFTDQTGKMVAVTGGGSGTGIAALINGTVDISNASRDSKDRERDGHEGTGRDPVEHVVAFDALAVYVHADNPIASIDKTKLGCIYGEKGSCSKWTDLWVEVPGCSGQEIVCVSRQNNSGTYHYFREVVMGDSRDFKLGSIDQSGSKDVVALVSKTPCAIGYSGMG